MLLPALCCYATPGENMAFLCQLQHKRLLSTSLSYFRRGFLKGIGVTGRRRKLRTRVVARGTSECGSGARVAGCKPRPRPKACHLELGSQARLLVT